MNFLNLEYFLVAAQELNFTKAAKKLYISQQSLSIHIARLEEYFDATFFVRTNPLALTAEGEYLLKRAKELLCIRDITKKELHALKHTERSELIIGAPRALGRLILPNILPSFNKQFPHVHLHLIEGSTDVIEQSLHHGDVDLSIGFLHDSTSNIGSEELYSENILLLVPDQILAEQYPRALAEARQKLHKTGDVKLIKDCPFLILASDTHTGSVAVSIFDKLNIKPKIILESKNLEILIALCFQNMGALFCPETFLSEAFKGKTEDFLSQMGVYTLNYEDANHTVCVNYLKSKQHSEPVQGFIRLAKAFFVQQEVHSAMVDKACPLYIREHTA